MNQRKIETTDEFEKELKRLGKKHKGLVSKVEALLDGLATDQHNPIDIHFQDLMAFLYSKLDVARRIWEKEKALGFFTIEMIYDYLPCTFISKMKKKLFLLKISGSPSSGMEFCD